MIVFAVILNYVVLLMAAWNFLSLITGGYYGGGPYLLLLVACPVVSLLVITKKPRSWRSVYFARKAAEERKKTEERNRIEHDERMITSRKRANDYLEGTMRVFAIILNIVLLWVGVWRLLRYITRGTYIAGPFGWFRCMGVFVLVACPAVNLLVVIVDIMPDWKYRKHMIAALVVGGVVLIVGLAKFMGRML